MITGGAKKICFVISPGKSDILEYYGAGIGETDMAFVVQPRPAGLCDALFRALPVIHPDEHVVIGLPDTIWFPQDALCALPNGILSFLLFPVERPEFFDAVITDHSDHVREIRVKSTDVVTNWIWGAFKMPGGVFHELHDLWQARERRDEYIGTLVNAWLGRGGEAVGVRAGESYVDVGTLHGYREATRLLSERSGRELTHAT